MTALQSTHSAPARAGADLGRDLITVTTRPDAVFVEGQGSWLTDEGGKRHLDLVQGWAVNKRGGCSTRARLCTTARCSTWRRAWWA
jgi:acetylornithine/succinyldiaminopimelate/putrescine aminotransferase